MSDNELSSELVQGIVERLNALTATTPDIEFAFVFSTDGETIAHSKLWDKPPDLKAVSPAIAEMAVTSIELIQKLPFKEPPAKPSIFEHIVFVKAREGYVVIMPINQRYWLADVVRYHAMLGLIMLDSYRACDDLKKLLPPASSG